MESNYHDKFPLAEQLEEMRNNQAAAKMLLSKRQDNVSEKEVKPIKIMVLLCFCSVALYLVYMMLMTLIVKQNFQEQYDRNLTTVTEYLVSDFEGEAERGNLTGYINNLYALAVAKEGYQHFSAAIYDADGKQLAMTGSYLMLDVDGEETYYIPLDQYFKQHEIMQLREYVKINQTKYMNEAMIDKETKTLVSFRIESVPTFDEPMTVWEWKHPKADSYDEDTLMMVYDKALVRDVVSIPYYNDEDAYERWKKDAYLQGFETNVDTDAEYPVRTVDHTFSEWQAERVGEISFEDTNGEKQSYYLSVRTSGYPLQATMDLLFFAYAIGAIAMIISVLVTIGNLNKLRARSK